MSASVLITANDLRRRDALQLSLSAFGLLLVVATWPLWFPQSEYPLIPWWGGLLPVSTSVDRALAVGLVLSQCGGVCLSVFRVFRAVRAAQSEIVGGPELIIANMVWLTCLIGSLLLDQHRLQVWAWEFLWLTLFLSVASPKTALTCGRGLVVGIYFYSAVSKFDAAFVSHQGPWLWQGLRKAIGLGEAGWDHTSPLLMFLFPVGELLVATLLVFRKSRRWGVASSWVMHLTLLLILGPWGWNQWPGVLLWNLFFLVSVPILFWPVAQQTSDCVQNAMQRREDTNPPSGEAGDVDPLPPTETSGIGDARGAGSRSSGSSFASWRRRVFALISGNLLSFKSPSGSSSLSWRDRFCVVATVALSLWPALEGFGLCDHWPAWAVYSSRPEIVSIDITEDQFTQLPPSLQPHVGSPLPLSDRRPLSLDHWSFASRWCPIYPQGRYRLAVARHLEQQYGVHLQVTLQNSPRRGTGQRDTHEITDLIQECDEQFWFNIQARSVATAPPLAFGDRMIAGTAQLAVACYAVVLLLVARRPAGARPSRVHAAVWTAGLLVLAAHVLCAFHFLHHWSHSAALKHTALRTAEVTGWSWPGGLYINYLFLLLWTLDVVRVWREALGRTEVASPWWQRTVHGVFLFMMFNATVVFGPWHWTVVSVLFAIVWCFLKCLRVKTEGLQSPGLK